MKKFYLLFAGLLMLFVCTNAFGQSYLMVSPENQSVMSGGGTFTGTISSNIDWQVTETETWITNINPSSGSGDGVFSYDVVANTSSNARTGVIVVSATDGSGVPDQTITVFQNAMSVSYMLLDPSVQNVDPDGGVFTGIVTSNVTWQVSTSEDWINNITPSNGSGSVTFTYDVLATTENNTRTGTITLTATDGSGVADQVITVVQAGLDDYYMNLDPSAQSVPPFGGNNYAGLVTSNVAWAVFTSDSWITNITPTTGSNNGTFSYDVAANGDNARTGTITLSATDGSGVPDQTITVAQAGLLDYYMNLDPSNQSVSPSGGAGFIGAVTSNVSWQVSTMDTWIANITPAAGTGDQSFTYDVGVNGNNARTGTITLSATDGSGVADKTITVWQSGQNDLYMIMDPEWQFVTPAGGNFTGYILSNAQWQLSESEVWIMNVSPSTGYGDISFSYSVSANTFSEARTGTITLSAIDGASGLEDKTITIVQEGVVGIGEQDQDAELLYYPNPFTNLISFELGSLNYQNVDIKIFDHMGRLVFEENGFEISDAVVFTWNGNDLSGKSLPNGMYSFVIFHHHNKVLTCKMVKTK